MKRSLLQGEDPEDYTSYPQLIFHSTYPAPSFSHLLNIPEIPMFFKEGDSVLLHLYRRYNTPAAGITKLVGQQHADPFERIGELACGLELPKHWRDHRIFSVAMLEPVPVRRDPFQRPVSEHPDSIYVEGDTESHKSWEVERIIRKIGNKYLIRWKGWGPNGTLERSCEMLQISLKTLRSKSGLPETRGQLA